MKIPGACSISECSRILLALTKAWRAKDDSQETLADARTALAKMIYNLGGQGFPDPANDAVIEQDREIWKDCLAASHAAKDEREKPMPPDGRYAVLWIPDETDASKLAPGLFDWPHQATLTFGPIIDADNQSKQLFIFEDVDDKTKVGGGIRPSPGFWPTTPATPLPISRLVRILIGTPSGQCRGGMAQLLRYILQYGSLFYRLALSIAVFVGFSVLNWFGLKWWGAVPFAADVGFLAIEIYASLIVIRYCADRAGGEVVRILAATWLPIVVIAVAAGLLFLNDQGLELGVGIMDGNYQALTKAFYLAPVLIYWALNNWLSARIGLGRAFPHPEKDQVLLFWGPRLVGVFAHLLAAMSLLAAALKQPDVQWKFEVAAGPLAILLATALVWCADTNFWSERDDGQKQLARKLIGYLAGVELLVFATLMYAWWTQKVPSGFFWGTLSIAASAIFFLVTISRLRKKAPLGKRADQKDRKDDSLAEQNTTKSWTGRLAAVMLAGTVWIWIRPMDVGQIFGSLNVACFAFGSFLALTNFLDLRATHLADYGGSRFKFGPRAVGAIFLCFLATPAFLASWKQSFHRVRLCNTNECTAAPTGEKDKNWSAIATPDQRPTVSEAALAWYAQAEVAYHKVHPEELDKPVPMLIVATAGGGIRAAYWTATIFETLEKDLSKIPGQGNESLMRNLLFAISGVSGGSVGAAAYAAALHDHEFFDAAIEPTKYLREDFLAPGLASLIFIDGPSNMLPDFGQIDRGKALELGFELASRTEHDKEGLVAHKFLSFFPAVEGGKISSSWRPALLLNATHQETGRRIITSHIKIERDIFIDSYDALHVLNSDVRLSTAAHNSARFTYVSPAGSLINAQSAVESEHNRGYVIDGGYFENYGAETALELARKAIEAIDPKHGQPGHKNKVKLVVLQISSDPALEEHRTLLRARMRKDGCFVSIAKNPEAKPTEPNYLKLIDPEGSHANEGEGFVFSYANELSAPLAGIMSVRQAHGTIAAEELAASICQGKDTVEQALQNGLDRTTSIGPAGNTGAAVSSGNDAPHFSHLAMCETSLNPPLGWVLSDRTRTRFEGILADCGNGEELAGLEQALGMPESPSFGVAARRWAGNTRREFQRHRGR